MGISHFEFERVPTEVGVPPLRAEAPIIRDNSIRIIREMTILLLG